MTSSTQSDFLNLHECRCCPRECTVDRAAGQPGFCQTGDGFSIASIFLHRGEEPVVSGANGICNIFFTHCNMQCIFCQNYQISRNTVSRPEHQLELAEVVKRVETILDGGVRSVGFVSASHCVPQVKAIIRALEERGRRPVFVFNTNAYDRKETIESLEGLIDVYLPDLKYMDGDLSGRYSQTLDYPEAATRSLKEMYRQKGSSVVLSDDGIADSGLIVRHLILPGHIENSRQCLRFIAEELSPSVHVSLMAQYYPTPDVEGYPELGRSLTQSEYDAVLEEFYRLGFYRGWVQELASRDSYRPDFDRPEVFE